IEINLDGVPETCRAQLRNEHLPGADSNGLRWMRSEGGEGGAFEDDQFVVAGRARFKQKSGASDPNRKHIAMNARAAGMFWHTHENRSVFNIDAASALIEAEDAVCAHARDRQIGKSKLRPRISAGADSRTIDHIIV